MPGGFSADRAANRGYMRLNCVAMVIFLEMRRLGALGLAPLLLAATAALAQSGASQATPSAPGSSSQTSASQNPQGQKSQGQNSQPVPLKPSGPGMQGIIA